MTTGSMFKLLEKEKHNPNAKEDLEKIKEFVDKQTGFRFAYGNLKGDNELTFKAVAK